jgi:hypothetical protein
MNKIKATKRDMRENHFIIAISYCLAQDLLAYEKPIAYSVGAYGWACDYYLINGAVISTGHSPLSSKNTKATYDMIKDYDNKALFIRNNGTYGQRANAINTLLCEFVEKAKENYRQEQTK